MNLIEVLSRIIEISHSNIEISARINGILKVLERNLEHSLTGLYVLDKDKRLTLKYTTKYNPSIEPLLAYRPLIGEGIIGQVAQKREAQFFRMEELPKRLGFLLRFDFDDIISLYRSFAFLPLSDETKCYGVLFAFSPKRTSFTEQEKRIFELASKELTGLLKIEELYIDSGRKLTELMTLSEIGKVLISSHNLNTTLNDISLIVAKALEADFVHIILLETNGGKNLSSAVYGEAEEIVKQLVDQIEKEVIRKKTPSFYSSLKGYAINSAPIIPKSHIVGALTVCKMTKEEAGPDNQYLITTITNYLSSGLENIILRTQLKEILNELNSANERLIQQEKLRSLGEMTANIAHEIKNPLVVIGGFAKRLAKKMDLKPQEKRYLFIILNEVQRLENILSEILNYARDIPLKRTFVRIEELTTELVDFFKSDPLWEKIEVDVESEEGLPPVFCDPEQIKQVFFNILVNAYEAMAGVGKINVKIFERKIGYKDYVCVSFADTGGGIDPLIIDNIFNPFFTTKEKGTGLGLSISNKIVLAHGGKIEVENQKGVGATFTVLLPQKEGSTTDLQDGRIANNKR